MATTKRARPASARRARSRRQFPFPAVKKLRVQDRFHERLNVQAIDGAVNSLDIQPFMESILNP